MDNCYQYLSYAIFPVYAVTMLHYERCPLCIVSTVDVRQLRRLMARDLAKSYNSSLGSSLALRLVGGWSDKNIIRKSCTKSAAAMPVISAEFQDLSVPVECTWHKHEKLTVIVRRRHFHNVSASAVQYLFQYVLEGQSKPYVH